MNKFLLRNLRNERKKIEKDLKRIDKKIYRIENTETIMEGSLKLGSLVKVEKSKVVFANNNIDFDMKFKIKFERIENEVICTLTTDDKKFDGVQQFTGIAKCAEDDTFDLSVGMTIAQNRAVKEVYEFILGLFA